MATHVGLLHLNVMINDAMTLKDKRRVVKSFKDRLASERNVSVSEVDKLDSIRQAVLAVAMVGNDARYIEGALQQVVNTAKAHRLWVLMDYEVEMV
jgi:uncharacterized protein